MNSCNSIKSHFSDYIDNLISHSDKKVVDTHLAVCPDCQIALKQVQAISQRLQVISPVKTSAQFDQNLRARIGNKTSSTESIFSVRTFSFGFSGMALAAVLAFFIMGNPENTGTNPNEMSGKPTSVQPKLILDSNDKTPAIAVEEPKQDSLQNSPAKIDKNKMHLVGQDRLAD